MRVGVPKCDVAKSQLVACGCQAMNQQGGSYSRRSDERDFHNRLLFSRRRFILIAFSSQFLPAARFETCQSLLINSFSLWLDGIAPDPPGTVVASAPQTFPARRQSSSGHPDRCAWRNPPLNASPAPVASTALTSRDLIRMIFPSRTASEPSPPSFTTGVDAHRPSLQAAFSTDFSSVIARASCSLGKTKSKCLSKGNNCRDCQSCGFHPRSAERASPLLFNRLIIGFQEEIGHKAHATCKCFALLSCFFAPGMANSLSRFLLMASCVIIIRSWS